TEESLRVMAINVSLAENHHQQSPNKKIIPRTKIKVFGIGGAGSNAVDSMIRVSMEGVDFVACNTDQQTLENSLAETKIQLGAQTTQGLGTGSNPKTGAQAAHEALDEIKEMISNTQLLFLTAGMGGGTGTGAISVIAKIARDMGVLTVAVVTKPFAFEGERRLKTAKIGIRNLGKYVDTLVVIDNQNLLAIADEKTTFNDAFNMTNEVVASGIKGVTDLMTMPGIINLDFSDITTIMGERGKALIGTAEEEGDDRAIKAAERALNNQLLDDVKLEHATGVLVNVTGGDDLGLLEVDRAVNMIKEAASENAQLIFGASASQKLQGKIRITILATGITHHHSDIPMEDDMENDNEKITVTEDKETKEISKNSETGQSAQTETEISKTDENNQDNQQQINETISEKIETPIIEMPIAEQAQQSQQAQQPQTQQAQQFQPQPQQPQLQQFQPQQQMPQQMAQQIHAQQQAHQQQMAQQQYVNMQQAHQQQAPYLNRNGNALPIHEMVISDDPINVPHHYRQNTQQMPIQGNNTPQENNTPQNAIHGDNIDVNNYAANLKLEQLRAKIHFANHAQPNTQIDNHIVQDIKQVQSQLDEISMNTRQTANSQNPQNPQNPQSSQNNGTGMVEHIQKMKPTQYDTDHNLDYHAGEQHDINIADDEYHGNRQYETEYDAQYDTDYNADYNNEQAQETTQAHQPHKVNIKRPVATPPSQHQAQHQAKNQAQNQTQAQAPNMESPNIERSKKIPFRLKRGGGQTENHQAETHQAEEHRAPLEKSKQKQEFNSKAKVESFDLPFDDKASDDDVAKEAVNGGKMLSRKELDIPAFLRRQAN
ncbi:MAG: cell division protein FtsZ, partial [Alphaproteobacteria bacterium]|nr:cell division protein FtsZ [Alphaproteobacteria bacterium]